MECERSGTGREDVVSERVGVSRDDGDDDIWWLLSKSVCDAAGDSVVVIPSGKPSFCRNASDMSKFGGRTDRDVRGASASYGDMVVGDAEREAVMEIVSVPDDRLRSKTCNEAIGPEDERAEVLVERDFGVIASDLFSTFTGFVSVCGDAWVRINVGSGCGGVLGRNSAGSGTVGAEMQEASAFVASCEVETDSGSASEADS